ncbi:MAG: YkgJ family cysteine cluster protein [Deltaproteobacteria bacterium]|nr:YkgJ family cysteine cluster protein [Deltaproteobacteria bacterium]
MSSSNVIGPGGPKKAPPAPGAAGGAFVCLRCGECCLGRGGVWLRAGETGPLAEFLGLEPGRLEEDFLAWKNGVWEVKTGPDDVCLFREPSGGCRVHSLKPAACRAWPFYGGPLQDEGAFLEAREVCPGLRPLDHDAFRRAYAAGGGDACRGLPPRDYR